MKAPGGSGSIRLNRRESSAGLRMKEMGEFFDEFALNHGIILWKLANFTRKIYKNWPIILENFYKIGQFFINGAFPWEKELF